MQAIAFDQAIKELSGERPRIAPPGRNGVVAFAVSGDITSPDQLNSSFNAAVRLGDRGAISAAVLAPDEATAQNNVLSRFFSTLKERSGGVAGVLDGVMDVWGRLLVGYGDIQGSADELMDEMIKGLGGGERRVGLHRIVARRYRFGVRGGAGFGTVRLVPAKTGADRFRQYH